LISQPLQQRITEGSELPQTVIYALWVVWIVSWQLAARKSDPTIKKPGASRETPYRVVTLLGAAALIARPASYNPQVVALGAGAWLAWTLAGVAALGFAFTWWARVRLGRLWSATVTRKADHHVVNTGPYAIVRHPIYTGILIAMLATALLRGTAAALVGVALLLVGFYLKARLEESFLRSELGEEAYSAYARRVPMLIPFAPA
jgi:protein-S-isoprenylcysteine O-methyltransferase Ste14